MARKKEPKVLDEKEMPFLDHLEELRMRLIKCFVAVFAGAIVVYSFSGDLLKILVMPYVSTGHENKLIFLDPSGGFMIYLEIALFGGIIVSVPVIFYQLWRFIAPGLYARERGMTLTIIAVSTFSFIVGAIFAYFIMAPIALKFLLGFQTELLAATLTIEKYLSFILTMILAAGLVFEFPLVAFFLAKIGLLSASFMREKRRYGIVLILIIAAVLTPPDVISQMLLAVPLLLLYEVSIIVVAMTTRRSKAPAETALTAIETSENPPPVPASITAVEQTLPGTPAALAANTTEMSGATPVSSLAATPPHDFYANVSDAELIQRIHAVKQQSGSRLLILSHHYQGDAIVNCADQVGDSFGLAKIAAESTTADYIVFCGVRFMAETARILARPNQIVVHPDVTAGCPLADFAKIEDVQLAWDTIVRALGAETVVPICYVNSGSEIKAFCGRNQGAVCTSANAHLIFHWARQQNKRIFFLPDANLGRNTAAKLGIESTQIQLWDPRTFTGRPTLAQLQSALVILWQGECHVHTHFTTDQILKMRQTFPQALIVVHPECHPEVVKAADANGSTEFIIRYVRQAAPQTTLIIGTEGQLVQRLKQQYADRTIWPLATSLCPDMAKINLRNLCWTLENLGQVNQVSLAEELQTSAKVALARMLEIT
ncbi:quinolinate synthase NadA [candidate division KSB1 bacterium]|nr:quinolinate synthase NadA [candidate division KSB1 bacterium]